MAQLLPELREEDAPPAVRAIYDDIKRATGIPQVNLIFRHLALEPAVLDWCWSVIGPLYHGGQIADAVARLDAGLSLPAHPPVWTGADAADEAGIRDVLAFYDRGNSSNLVGLRTLLHVAGGVRRRDARPARTPHPSANGGALPAVPPLPRVEAVPPDLMALIDELSGLQGTADFGVRPSLWLHLTLWPRALRQGHATARPLLESREWPGLLDDLRNRTDDLAAELAQELRAPAPAASREVLQPFLATVRRFVDLAIPQMLLIGRVLSGGHRPGA